MNSIRCKVCNVLKIENPAQKDTNDNWECQNCGSIFDVTGNYVTVG